MLPLFASSNDQNVVFIDIATRRSIHWRKESITSCSSLGLRMGCFWTCRWCRKLITWHVARWNNYWHICLVVEVCNERYCCPLKVIHYSTLSFCTIRLTSRSLMKLLDALVECKILDERANETFNKWRVSMYNRSPPSESHGTYACAMVDRWWFSYWLIW